MKLNCKTYGSGPGLIILHGLFGSLDNWQTLSRRYAEHFSVFIVDLRNHGKSPHSDEPFTYSAMAEDILEFMDDHSIPKTSIIGHSMGGKAAMKFAIQSPERMEKLVVADMGMKENKPSHVSMMNAMRNFPFDRITTRQGAEEYMSSFVSDPGVKMFLLKSLDRKKDNSFEWKFNIEVISRDYSHILEGVYSTMPLDLPVQFVRGGNSDYVSDADIPEIRKSFPNVKLETIAGAGHWLHSDKPDDFFQITQKFLLE